MSYSLFAVYFICADKQCILLYLRLDFDKKVYRDKEMSMINHKKIYIFDMNAENYVIKIFIKRLRQT